MAIETKCLVVCGLIGVGVVLQIVATATPAWTVGSVRGNDWQIGPWKTCADGVCVDIKVPSECDDDLTDGTCSKLRSVQAFSVIGCLAGAGAALCALTCVVMDGSNKKTFSLCALACGFVSFVSVVITAILMGEYFKPDGLNFGYSFALSIVGGVLVLAGAVGLKFVSRT